MSDFNRTLYILSKIPDERTEFEVKHLIAATSEIKFFNALQDVNGVDVHE